MNKLYILRKDFLDWYFKNTDFEAFIFNISNDLKNSLITKGSYTITVNELVKNTKAFHKNMPLKLIQGFSDEKPELKIQDLFNNFELFII